MPLVSTTLVSFTVLIKLVSAVASHLALYSFTLKTSPPSQFNPNNKEKFPEKLTFAPISPSKEWDEGVIYANAQNFARTVSANYPTCHLFIAQSLTNQLTELPANILTPTVRRFTFGSSEL